MAALIPSASATGSGTMTLAGPSTNSNQTITIPDTSGSMMVSGNMPAFCAYQTSATALTGGGWTKITFNTELFDTNNNFASSTFTPTVAGYYQINAQIQYDISSVANANIRIYKNGSALVQGNYLSLSLQNAPCVVVSGLIYCNGTTDTIEIYGNIGTSCNTLTGLPATMFSGAMVRGA
jgi:hypothetical protein